MRLTCLKCGHQVELSGPAGLARVSCVCGQDYTYPEVVNTGTRPSERAAERSRSKAFRAAGLVKNFGGFALGISMLGILFFPVALVGAAIGIYVLTMVRGPVARYSGRRQAALAVLIGVSVFIGEGALALSWLQGRRLQRMAAVQSSVAEDLRALLRSQRLHRATTDTYGTFHEFRFEPRFGLYTIYLGPDEFIAAQRDGGEVVDPLPQGAEPGVSEDAFTAVAVANLDGDPALDAWLLNEHGDVEHLVDDVVAEDLLPVEHGTLRFEDDIVEASLPSVSDAAVQPESGIEGQGEQAIAPPTPEPTEGAAPGAPFEMAADVEPSPGAAALPGVQDGDAVGETPTDVAEAVEGSAAQTAAEDPQDVPPAAPAPAVVKEEGGEQEGALAP